jgi:uncharacterized protein YdhG (YjbR/CyaY superfamily)
MQLETIFPPLRILSIVVSLSKQHISIAPEQAGINQFIEAIENAGYNHTKEIFRIKWNQTKIFP